jgi:hypothetical protein
MTAITLDNPTHDQADSAGPDRLAGALLYSLSRPMPDKGMWGLARTVLLGVLSFGLWPLFEWIKRFGDLARAESVQWEHLAEWLRLRSGYPESAELARWIPRTDKGLLLRSISLVCGVGVIWAFFLHLHGQFSWAMLMGATYRGGLSPLTARLFTIWTIGLGVGYLVHWLNVALHVRATERLIGQINSLAQREGFGPMPTPAGGWGLRPMWLVAGIVLTVMGAGWGLPMMLAGALQRRYVLSTGRRMRGMVAERLRAMLSLRHPTMSLPTPVMLRRRCDNPVCRSTVSMAANYCPRCGSRLWASVDRVA